MSFIDTVQKAVGNNFQHLSATNYLRMLDTPHVWGMPFGKQIMSQAQARQADFQRAIEEIVQKAKYRCDISSLNSPDPDWARPILGAMDTALSTRMSRARPTQFRFLFGQTPMNPFTEPTNFADFKAALIRLVRMRQAYWEMPPEIWMGRFYRLQEGILSSLKTKLFVDSIISNDDTKMTWNHSKIVAVDGCEALAGGHNLNWDLFRSYPPVHDASTVVHGPAAYGAQLFLNEMWNCGYDLMNKESLDTGTRMWVPNNDGASRLVDPLQDPAAQTYITGRQNALIQLHQAAATLRAEPAPGPSQRGPGGRPQDLQVLADLPQEVFPLRVVYTQYDKLEQYRKASRMLVVGKYWNGPNLDTNYKKGSELMKEALIKGAQRSICMSQMDLISAWKSNWSDHVVCQWVIEALLANPNLNVKVVVSPLDAGAGAEGDQYSFGSGGVRTFDLIKYYMTHDVASDAPLGDADGKRAAALKRIRVAPFSYTDQVPNNLRVEGDTYKWPDLSPEGYTATLKQKPLSVSPPSHGSIGSAAMSLIQASGDVFSKVRSAPGNHAKITIVDDEIYVIGSDNLYPGSLSEFNYLVEGSEAVNDLIESYWKPLWKYSDPMGYGG